MSNSKMSISMDNINMSISGDGFLALLLTRSSAEKTIKSFLQSFYYETAGIIDNVTGEQMKLWWEDKTAKFIHALENNEATKYE